MALESQAKLTNKFWMKSMHNYSIHTVLKSSWTHWDRIFHQVIFIFFQNWIFDFTTIFFNAGVSRLSYNLAFDIAYQLDPRQTINLSVSNKERNESDFTKKSTPMCLIKKQMSSSRGWWYMYTDAFQASSIGSFHEFFFQLNWKEKYQKIMVLCVIL